MTLWGSIPTLPVRKLRLTQVKITCAKLPAHPLLVPQIPRWPLWWHCTCGTWLGTTPLYWWSWLSFFIRLRPAPFPLHRLGGALSNPAHGFSVTRQRTQWGSHRVPAIPPAGMDLCSVQVGWQMHSFLGAVSPNRAKDYWAIICDNHLVHRITELHK